MADTKKSKEKRDLEHKFRIMAAAKLRLSHAELAQEAADRGLLELYEEHSEFADAQQATYDELKKKRIR